MATITECGGVVFTKGGCAGHISKFADCKAEALWSGGLDYADDDTGSCDFEGHVMLFAFDQTEGIDIDHDGKRLALVPRGNYILFTAPGGGVSLWEYESRTAAMDEFDRWQQRYEEWDSQDD